MGEYGKFAWITAGLVQVNFNLTRNTTGFKSWPRCIMYLLIVTISKGTLIINDDYPVSKLMEYVASRSLLSI